ncbi:MerR family transcriptional regulator [Ruegeria marisrubri]|uniref:MerR family transcriptional regulator n=1 Tax=Ruegeria marisrubri TaxID=1685379 RepID=UPI001CD54EA2|nr:MerR family transcriptional regulator [Ruegeria marisrubri]MCA0904886.1 MerR family transcriptional regulator [Ruegeria marisrubri]
MSKSPDAFRTISEVADWLGVQAHVLRFWESRFTQVKPVKRAGGRRYYRPNDMRLLGGIKKLLHEDGITIKGVQRILREQGVAHVAALSPSLDDHGAAPIAPAQDTVVPFEPKPAPATEQIRMDLRDPIQPTGKDDAQTNAPASDASQPEPEPELDAAPLMGGIASLAWNQTDFDDDLLRRIAPIAKDLRRWLDRVETQATG